MQELRLFLIVGCNRISFWDFYIYLSFIPYPTADSGVKLFIAKLGQDAYFNLFKSEHQLFQVILT